MNLRVLAGGPVRVLRQEVMLVCRCDFGSSGDVSSFFPLARGGGLKNVRAADGKDFPSPIASDEADPAAY